MDARPAPEIVQEQIRKCLGLPLPQGCFEGVRHVLDQPAGQPWPANPDQQTPYLSLASGSGHENGPVLTSLRAVASSVGPAPNDGHHRATPQAPHAGLRA